MTTELKNVAELEEATKALNARTDEINKRLAEFVELLKGISPGVQCWTFINKEQEFQLGYTRITNEWGLMLKYGKDPQAQYVEVMQGRRDQRLVAYKNRQKLLDALVETVKHLSDRMDKALANQTEEGIDG